MSQKVLDYIGINGQGRTAPTRHIKNDREERGNSTGGRQDCDPCKACGTRIIPSVASKLAHDNSSGKWADFENTRPTTDPERNA